MATLPLSPYGLYRRRLLLDSAEPLYSTEISTGKLKIKTMVHGSNGKQYLKYWHIPDLPVQPWNPLTRTRVLTRAQLWDIATLLSTCTTAVILMGIYNRGSHEKLHQVVVTLTFMITTGICLGGGVSEDLILFSILPWTLLLALLSSRISEEIGCFKMEAAGEGCVDEKTPARL